MSTYHVVCEGGREDEGSVRDVYWPPTGNASV